VGVNAQVSEILLRGCGAPLAKRHVEIFDAFYLFAFCVSNITLNTHDVKSFVRTSTIKLFITNNTCTLCARIALPIALVKTVHANFIAKEKASRHPMPSDSLFLRGFPALTIP